MAALLQNPPFPGYNVTPNTPYRLNAAKGSTVYFYYIYSYPGQGEHNTAGNMDAFKIGNCFSPNTGKVSQYSSTISYYPNPVTTYLIMQFQGLESSVKVYDIRGKLIESFIVRSALFQFDMSSYPQGIYFFEVINAHNSQNFKVVKD